MRPASADGTDGRPPSIRVHTDRDGRERMSDDDWFERALRETGEGTDAEEDASDDDGDAADRDAATADDAADDDAFDDLGASADADDDVDDDGSPFDEDFATAFEDAPDPGGAAADDPAGDAGGFELPAGSGGSPSDGFDDDDEFESAIPRIDVGVDGLDNMILGGVPRRSLIAAVGSAGTGKTTFGLQFLHRALSEGERAVYLTLEESSERIVDTAEEKGWPFERYADEGRLAVVHLDPVEMANSLANIRNELPDLVDEFGADRLVLDSVSLLEMMYDHPSDRRSEVYQFTRSLKESGVTTLVTSEASGDNPYSSRYGIVEYLADAVFVLQYVRPSDFQETRLAVEIQKIRDANHSRETKPYEITDEGITVYRQANIF
jgi:KaiC domain protein